MKTINDLETMSSLDLFNYHKDLKKLDEKLKVQLEYWHEQCCNAFNTCMEDMSKRNYELLELAMNTYKSVLNDKVVNKSEIDLVQRIARRRNINLKKHIIVLEG